MKLGIITPEYPHPQVATNAGIGTSTKNLVDALVKNGVVVTVFVYQQEEEATFKENGVTVYLIPKKKYTPFTWYYYRKHLQKFINTKIEEEQIDIIEAPDWTGITAFMKFKIPLVVRFHGSDAYFCELEHRKQKFKNFMFERLALNRAKAYISPTKFTKELTAKLFSLNTNKIKVIANSISVDNFNNVTPNTYEKKTLLYVGTLIRKKGVFELVKIFNEVVERVPDAQLILIGSDAFDVNTNSVSSYQLMQAMFSENAKARVKYLGKIPYSNVVNYMKNAHVCIFPSFAESFGMVTVESMAMQKPVVNTSMGWANEIIDDTINGYLVHPTDTTTYVERIIALFNDAKLCSKLGKAARKKVESNFNSDTIAEQNISFYKALISEKNS